MSDESLENPPKKTPWIPIISLSVLGFLFLVFVFWLFFLRLEEYTSDAYVEGNQVYITPLHSGFVTAIHTDDTFLVRKGQVLVQLDTADAIIALDQAQKWLAQAVREVCQDYHQVFVYKADIEIKKAELIKAYQDFTHRNNVLQQGGVSLEDYEHAVAAYRASEYSLKLSQSLYEKALAFVQGTSIRRHPKVLAAADQVRKAWIELYRCSIYAPVDGIVAQRTIQVGMQVQPGEPLMSVIPLNQIWVNANYKETQMKRMRIGQKVRLTSDLYGRDVVYNGTIVGLPGGAGNTFSLLPPQNLSGNWIKIVQRLPVRVEIDPDMLQQYPLRLGLSMEARADLSDQEGSYLPNNSCGAPFYATTVYDQEEAGDAQLVETILQENMDPTLQQYFNCPLCLSEMAVSFES